MGERGVSYGEVIHRTFLDRIKSGELDLAAARQVQDQNTYRETGKRVGQEGIEVKGPGGTMVFENAAKALDWVESTGGLVLSLEGKISFGRKVEDIFDELEKNKKPEA